MQSKFSSFVSRHRVGFVTGVSVLPLVARADDAGASAVTAIQAAAVSVGLVGAAILALKVGMRVYHWIGQSVNK